MPLEFRADAETAASLQARAARCRGLSRVALPPFAPRMLAGLAQQLEGEAARAVAAPDASGDDPSDHQPR